MTMNGGGAVNNFAREIEYLRKQVDEIEGRSNEPEDLKEVLLETCNGLLVLLNDIQDGQSNRSASQNTEVDLHHIIQALDRSQHNLIQSEGRYRAIVEGQIELICRFTPDGILTFYNEAFRQYFAPFGEVEAGRSLQDIIPKEGHTFTHYFTSILHPALSVTRFEYRITFPDSKTYWQQWNGMGYFDKQGALVEIQAVGHDITERKQAEISADQHNRELNALHTATAALLSTLDPEALLSLILDAALSAIPAAKKGMIHLIAQDTGQLEMRASIGYSDPRIRRFRVPGSMGYVAKSVRERKPLLVSDMQADPTNYNGQMPEARDIQSAIVAPLVLNHQVLGAISLESNQLKAFSQSDLELFTSFAATATAALHNARLHGEVQKLAITDALTGLYNRRGFFELGQREVERSRRFERPLVAIMMDIDRFKYINDVYGHAAGDRVLQAVAKRCSDNLRRIDILGRFGGDEFTLLLPETDIFRAKGVAERMRQCVSSSPVSLDDTQIDVSVSLGIARATAATPDLEVLISRADAAMYVAKQSGRNRVEYG
jgi:diguanylate cyclase (GGDEF)-like protein/PAS domain S-box-containing protein